MIATPATVPAEPGTPVAPPRAHLDPLSALLSSTLPISDLAASLDLSIPDFLNLYQSPDFQSQLTAIDDLTQTRLRIQSAQARLTAIHALESLTKSAQDPVERRRAAASLMRATAVPSKSALGLRCPDGDPDGDQVPDDDCRAVDQRHRPRARHLPSRRLRAEQVATLIARALADNATPAPDPGPATPPAFPSSDTRAPSPHLPDFIPAAHDQSDDTIPDTPARTDRPLPDLHGLTDLLDAPSAATCSAQTQHGRTATVDLLFPPPPAHSPLPTAPPIRGHLTRPDTGPPRMCWLIDRITRQPSATGPPTR